EIRLPPLVLFPKRRPGLRRIAASSPFRARYPPGKLIDPAVQVVALENRLLRRPALRLLEFGAKVIERRRQTEAGIRLAPDRLVGPVVFLVDPEIDDQRRRIVDIAAQDPHRLLEPFEADAVLLPAGRRGVKLDRLEPGAGSLP